MAKQYWELMNAVALNLAEVKTLRTIISENILSDIESDANLNVTELSNQLWAMLNSIERIVDKIEDDLHNQYFGNKTNSKVVL